MKNFSLQQIKISFKPQSGELFQLVIKWTTSLDEIQRTYITFIAFDKELWRTD